MTKKKQTRLQKEASPGGTKSDNSGRSSDNNQEDSFVKQTPIPVDIVSSSSRESSVTPTLTQTPTKKDSPVFRSRDADSSSSGSHLKSPTPTQTPTKRDSPVCSNAGISVSSGNGLKLPTVTQTPTKKDSPIFRDADSVSSSNRLKSSTPTQTPTKRDSSISSIAGSSLSSNRLKLKRKRLPNISKEPSIKLSRVDTEFVASLKKPKPDQQKANQVSCDNNINANGTTSNRYAVYCVVKGVIFARLIFLLGFYLANIFSSEKPAILMLNPYFLALKLLPVF